MLISTWYYHYFGLGQWSNASMCPCCKSMLLTIDIVWGFSYVAPSPGISARQILRLNKFAFSGQIWECFPPGSATSLRWLWIAPGHVQHTQDRWSQNNAVIRWMKLKYKAVSMYCQSLSKTTCLVSFPGKSVTGQSLPHCFIRDIWKRVFVWTDECRWE